MKSTHLLLSLGAVGLLAGYAGHRLTATSRPETTGSSTRSEASDKRPAGPARTKSSRKKPAKKIELPPVQSGDTLETLKALPPGELYARLALWMVDASEEDIAAYWQHYHVLDQRANEITDLIFINWARIDPQAAVDAAAGTSDEHYSWWAWACHDPAASLAAVVAQNPGRLNNVTWGIGEFHPDWAREHWDEIPEQGQRNILQGMAKWDDVANPLETLTFLREKGYGFHHRMFKVFITKDPWGAYEWVQQNGMNPNRYSGHADTLAIFVEAVSTQHPDVLERLASQAPSGALKRRMESALFANLLKTDPEAAKEQALATEAPKIAVERLPAVGLSLLASDPDQAFAMAGRLFSISSNPMTNMTRVVYEGGGTTSYGSGKSDVTRLMSALVARDPDRAIALALPKDGQSGSVPGPGPAYTQIAKIWADQDLDGYAEWVNGQEDPAIHLAAAGVMITKLQQDQAYDAAAEWVMSLAGENERQGHLQNLISKWSRLSPQDAAAWMESADLTDKEMERVQRYFPSKP